jgi:hypothetical protein
MVGSGVDGLLFGFLGEGFFWEGGRAMTASFIWLRLCTEALTGRG